MRRPFRDAVDATVASMAYELYQTLRPNAAVAMLARTHTYPPGTDKTRVRPLARHRRDAIQPTQAHLVKLKKGQVNVLRNKVRFILAVLSEELVVHNRKKARRGAPVIISARRDSLSRAGRAFSPARRGRLRRSYPGEREETEDCGRGRRRRVGRRGGQAGRRGGTG